MVLELYVELGVVGADEYQVFFMRTRKELKDRGMRYVYGRKPATG